MGIPYTQFVSDLDESRERVNRFAAIQQARGLSVWMPPTSTTGSFEDRMKFTDSGDLMIQLRVEHKFKPNATWTGRDDFPYETMIIDEVYKVDRLAKASPWFMYVIEAPTGYIACIHSRSKPHWIKQRRHDRRLNEEREFYFVHKSRIHFCRVEEF